MKDQMLEDKYNELGKAHAEAMNQLAKKDEIIKELKKFATHSGLCDLFFLKVRKCSCGLEQVIEKIEELES